MDNFVCKAPMYVNFVQSSVLDESDDADKFFDGLNDGQYEQQSEGQCRVKEEPQENENDIPQNHNEQQVGDLHDETNTEQSTGMDDVLNVAMTNLHLASGQHSTSLSAGTSTSKTKGLRSSMQEYCNFKRKGSPLFENYQPRKFISLAEAVCQFQTNTPDRFHSRPKTDKLRSSLQHRKGITVKRSTIPHSPNLRSHLRSRPVHYLTREEQEEKEAEEMKGLQVKASALNPKILEQPPTLGVRVERKPPTVPVPFKLTEIVRKKSTAPPVFTFTAKPVPKAILNAPQGIPKKEELPLTVPASPACLKKSKVYAMSLDVKDGEKCLMQKEIHGFGIPASASTDWKRTTEVQPFSFDARDQLFLKKKEENVKKYLEQEKAARQFHANPMPASVKTPNSIRQHLSQPTEPSPFQLEVEKRGMIKQQQLKQKLEGEARKLQEAAQFKARPADVIHKKPFEPKKSERPLTDITTVELNTERRAKEREEFDAMIKEEHAKVEEFRRMRDEKLKREEMEEVARLRKESVHKANPIRRYKPTNIMGSNKLLTDPHSPSFMSHPRANSK